MKETMKEVVIIGPKQFEVREVPVPKPADNEVLIQMKAAGVCGSDVHQFLGENPNAVFPRVPGHENAGVIVEVGKDVKNVKVGDHVVVDLVVACGECPQCRAGRRNVCRQVKARGSAIDGGWREYFAVPEHEVYVMPKELPFRDAALIEPFAIGGHCTARANIQGGETVLVLGSGTIGAVILQTLKVKGCRVMCADINPSSLERARGYGADAIVNTKEQDLKQAVQEFTNGAFLNAWNNRNDFWVATHFPVFLVHFAGVLLGASVIIISLVNLYRMFVLKEPVIELLTGHKADDGEDPIAKEGGGLQ